jgi:hypothetical protein
MKLVDPASVDVVHSGEAWAYQHPPCSRHMMRHLEKNEGLVTWVQVFSLLFQARNRILFCSLFQYARVMMMFSLACLTRSLKNSRRGARCRTSTR